MDIDSSLISDSNADSSMWESPGKAAESNQRTAAQTAARPTYEQQQAREQELRQELENVRRVNQAIEGVIESLGKARANMKTVNTTVDAASTLLNTWTRILSQTEHNQRLILDPNWHGASQDIADMEQEGLEKQRAAERREAEDQDRRDAAAKRAQEEEKRKASNLPKQSRPPSARGTSSRMGTTARGSSASSSTSYVQMGGSGNSTTSTKRGSISTRRTTSGIGRGGVSRGGKARG